MFSTKDEIERIPLHSERMNALNAPFIVGEGQTKSHANNAVARLTVGNIFVGFSSLFIVMCGLDPLSLGFYRMGFAAFALTPCVARNIRSIRSCSPKWWIATAFGAAAWIAEMWLWQLSIHDSGAAIATLLNNIQVFLLPLFGALWFGERITKRSFLCSGAATIGLCVLVMSPDRNGEPAHILGVLSGLASGVCYAFYLCASTYASRMPGAPSAFVTMFVHTAVTGIGFGAIGAATLNGGITFPTASVLVLLAVYGVTCQVLGWSLIQSSLHKAPSSVTSICLLIQPMMAFVTDIFYVGRGFSAYQFAGFGIIGVCVAAQRNAPNTTRERRGNGAHTVTATPLLPEDGTPESPFSLTRAI